MKKILLVLFAFISLNAFSQLQVKEGSFKHIPGGIIEDKEKYTDPNGSPMALIKISTENINEQERQRLVFNGNRETQILKEPKTGQMWVYITAEAATFINIKHPDYGTYKYYLPEKLCDYCVYEMVLQYIQANDQVGQNNYLIIKVDKADARIYIDEEYVGKQFAHKQFQVGSTHTWKIECELCRAESGSVTITNDENLIDITMLPEFGYLNVTTTPENGAQVYINDSMVGVTPYRSDKLSIGKHTVKVVKDKFKMSEQIVVVEDKKTSNANIQMISVFVDVTVESDSNSDVLINGVFKGKGYWTGKLHEGTYVFEAKKENHRTIRKTVEIVAGNNQTIKLGSPEPIDGSYNTELSYLGRNVNFITLNAAYSIAPQTSFGFTFGSVKIIGWYVSVMSNFDFTGFDMIDKSYEEVILTGNTRSTRISVIGGMVANNFKLGLGYGMILRCCETAAGDYVEYTPNTYRGFDLAAGFQFDLKNITLEIDAVTTNLRMIEIKLGVGFNWNKR